MRILLYLCYRGYSVKGTFSSLNKPAPSTNYLQDILEKAILRFCPARRPKILLSTYTECNVHSLCNTATVDFELPGKQKLGTGELNIPWFKFNINRMLLEANRTMRVIDARFVHDAFEPKLAALHRTYLYRFSTSSTITVMEQPLTTYLSSPVSLPLLRSAISLIHNRSLDYSSFTTAEARALIKDTNRIVGITLSEAGSLFSSLQSKPSLSFCLQLTCTNFLYQMVRRLTADLIQVAQGKLTLEQFEQKLSSPSNNNQDKLLDINGLYLQNVMYDEQDFERYVTYTTLTTKKNAMYPLAPVLTGEE
ncbi:unnamed protein product [Rotaria socialis]|uniref:tRNA pseudouridine synthase n=1 Tax=Rotaria socialis TaxID=392032 RepID=A0A820ZU80_9BILA|nr:unnamed protein product [Rotaria socialis]CAF3518477.1 unnamed protein product [Rotaria socialis]CAF3631237.1 unnamed protein product [Rotaria socialis]CAF4231133.1 unnamed protein product [Rotaria socialis]CAF4231539.1 unnamed protein product [Rotaria socialis]